MHKGGGVLYQILYKYEMEAMSQYACNNHTSFNLKIPRELFGS